MARPTGHRDTFPAIGGDHEPLTTIRPEPCTGRPRPSHQHCRWPSLRADNAPTEPVPRKAAAAIRKDAAAADSTWGVGQDRERPGRRV